MNKAWLDELKLDVANANNCSYTLTRDELYFLLMQQSPIPSAIAHVVDGQLVGSHATGPVPTGTYGLVLLAGDPRD